VLFSAIFRVSILRYANKQALWITHMREYDNIEYRYRTNESNSEAALRFISRELGYSPDTSLLKFDLSFFSGGIGVFDKLAFSCGANDGQWEALIQKLSLLSPSETMMNEEWAEDLTWLVRHSEPYSIEESCAQFINTEKKQFQGDCTPDCKIFFSKESNVNTWTAIWGKNGDLNYLHFDQG
jgi:hypothetical protein